MFSTVPSTVPTRMTSPRANWCSSWRKNPVTKSRTRLCEPNEMARPTTPALASSGEMLKPS